MDINEERASEVAAELGVKAFTSHRDVLGQIDAATVAVPTTQHHHVAEELMENGVHLLVEKPLAATLDEARSLVATAKKCGVALQVGHIERFSPTALALRERLTHPVFIECHRVSPFPARGTDVDVVLDLMIHDIDLLLDFLDSPVVRIDAVGVPILTSKYDIVNARFRFECGCTANVTASRVAGKNMRKMRFFQKDAYISADFYLGEIVTHRRLPSEREGLLPKIDVERLAPGKGDPLLGEVISFVDAVRFGKTPVVDGTAAERCMEVAARVVESIRESTPDDLWEVMWGDTRCDG